MHDPLTLSLTLYSSVSPLIKGVVFICVVLYLSMQCVLKTEYEKFCVRDVSTLQGRRSG